MSGIGKRMYGEASPEYEDSVEEEVDETSNNEADDEVEDEDEDLDDEEGDDEPSSESVQEIPTSQPSTSDEPATEDVPAKKRKIVRKTLPLPAANNPVAGPSGVSYVSRGKTAQQHVQQPQITVQNRISPVMNQEQPSSSNNSNSNSNNIQQQQQHKLTVQANMAVEQMRHLARENERLKNEVKHSENLMKELAASVECPVCLNVPRAPPVPCCPRGHIVCKKCKPQLELCPTCRTPFEHGCVSQLAALVIGKVPHDCEYRDQGCGFRGLLPEIEAHERECPFRLVRCPHWACDESITVKRLTHHVIASECGDNYRDRPLPYREEMEYARGLDDEEGNGFWRPSLIQYDGITFYLQVEKCGTSKNWYFYVQMEGSLKDCEKYGATIRVSKSLDTTRHSIIYDSSVCPIDIKGVAEVETSGAGLNIRNSVMEQIFDVDRGQGGDHQEEERYRFWVEINVFKNVKTEEALGVAQEA